MDRGISDKMYLLNGLLIFCLLLFCPLDGFAKKMYKWVDKEGQVHFTDQKPPEEATDIKESGKDGIKEPEPVENPKLVKVLDLKILDTKVKILERANYYITFSLRVKVRCTDPKFRGDAKVWLRALDRKGFELDTAWAKGKINPGRTSTLSGSNHWKYKLYKQIDKWELTNLTFF